MTLQYHYTVPGDDFVHAGEASGHLKGVLRQLGYPGDTIRRVAISMYEGEINMVIHANGGEIDAEIDDRGVTVTLRDQGPGIPDVEKARQPMFTTGGEERSGMGFCVMQTFMDAVEVESAVGQGTTVTMRKYITGEVGLHRERMLDEIG